MLFFFHFFLVIFLSLSPTEAIVFDTDDQLNIGNREAHKTKTDILPGKIVIKDGDRTLDYCSAVVVGKPGEERTRSILSCAHIMKDFKPFDRYQYYFQDERAMHLIERVLLRSESQPTECADLPLHVNLTPHKDLALYYLKTAIPCNPNVDLAEAPLQEATLSCLSYGITITPTGQFGVGNTDGTQAYSVTNDFRYSEGTYTQKFTADRLVQIYTQKNQDMRHIYIAQPGSPSQIFPQDSGAPWFSKNTARGGYTLSAITCSTSCVEPSDILACTQKNILRHIDYSWIGAPWSLNLCRLESPIFYINRLTALAPHREWILGNCL